MKQSGISGQYLSPQKSTKFLLRNSTNLCCGNESIIHEISLLSSGDMPTVKNIARQFKACMYIKYGPPILTVIHRIWFYRKIHYLTREFRVKLHTKTNIARIAKRWVRYWFSNKYENRNKMRKKENSNNVVRFYPERALHRCETTSLSLVFNSQFYAKYNVPHFVNQSENKILFNYAILILNL